MAAVRARRYRVDLLKFPEKRAEFQNELKKLAPCWEQTLEAKQLYGALTDALKVLQPKCSDFKSALQLGETR